MVQQLYLIFKSVRPRQWLKNLAVYAALVFSGLLFSDSYFLTVSYTFLIYCGVTSSVYLFNDIVDAPQDRKHPFKKKRPIAAGTLSIRLVGFVAGILLIGSLIAAWMLSLFLFLILLTYLFINVIYSLSLKHLPIMDVMVIAAGFILRVYAGAVVVDLHLNVWFLLTVVSLSLFLAVGKRQSERTLLSGYGSLSGHRETLETYSTRLLDVYTAVFAAATWITYALFAFQQQFQTSSGNFPVFIFSRVPRAFVAQKWLMITVPIVIYGVMRYLQLVYEKNEGESPERVLLNDTPLLASVMVWGVMVIFILYVVGG